MIHTHSYDNGLTLLAEPMAGVASASMTLLLPGGAVREPENRQGLGAVLSEMLYRGAGELDARAHAEALDALGARRSCESSTWSLRLGATLMGDRLSQAMPLLFDMVRRPHLSESDFEPAQTLALQEIEGLEDEPQDKVMIELKRRFLNDPAGRSPMGRLEDLKALTLEEVRACHAAFAVPSGAILSVAGCVSFEALRDQVAQMIEGWIGAGSDEPSQTTKAPELHYVHADSSQHHIAMACPSVGERHADTMVQRLAVAVLSGGMSGRLFTEVRENRGLCYSVYASYAAHRDAGAVYAYAGTTPQRAQETLDVLSHELKRLREGVTRSEFERAVIGLRSRLVMQGESTAARASAIANDQYLLGNPRTLESIDEAVCAVTFDQLNAFVAEHPMQDFAVMAVGPEPLVGMEHVS